MEKAKSAVLVDLANMEDYDLRDILEQTRQEGFVEEALCYGDFRQAHLIDRALEIYALGFTMIHCPSWNAERKRSDDRLLEKSIYHILAHRPQIQNFVLVTSDADIIPAALTILEYDKRLVLYSKPEGLGGILRLCGFEVRQVPRKRNGNSQNLDLNLNELGHQTSNDGVVSVPTTLEGIGISNQEPENRELNPEKTLREIEYLEKTCRYLTFMQTVGKVANGDCDMKEKIRDQISRWITEGIIEKYEYCVPAIRLNRAHPSVVSAIRRGPITEKAEPKKELVMSSSSQS